MSAGTVCVFEDQDVDEVVRVMEERQIRRAPVLSREKRLVAIVSLGWRITFCGFDGKAPVPNRLLTSE